MRNKTDSELLDRIKKGNEHAFSQLFENYWETLFLFAFNMLKDEELAKDTVQEVFISLWNRREELEILHIKAYLFKATKFRLAKTLRDNPQFTNMPEQFEAVASTYQAEENIEVEELSQRIEQSLDGLPEKCGLVFKMSRLDGFSNKEIAGKLGLSLSTVENHINKALHIIRNDLKEFRYAIVFLPFWF